MQKNRSDTITVEQLPLKRSAALLESLKNRDQVYDELETKLSDIIGSANDGNG